MNIAEIKAETRHLKTYAADLRRARVRLEALTRRLAHEAGERPCVMGLPAQKESVH